MKDYLTDKQSAEELAQTIRNWWFTRTGKTPDVRVEKQEVFCAGDKVKNHYVIRSNMRIVVPSKLTPQNTVTQSSNVISLLRRK